MNPTKSNPIKAVLTISTGLLVIFFVFKLNWALKVSAIIGVAGLASNYFAMQIERIWNKLSFILSLIVPNILLSLLFYFFVFPISVLSKLFRKKDFLLLKNPTQSTFIESTKSVTKETFEKPW